MAVRYQIRNKGKDNWEQPVKLWRAIAKARFRVGKRPAPYFGYEKGRRDATVFKRWKVGLAADKLKDKLKAAHTGETWRLEATSKKVDEPPFFVAVKKVEVGPDLAPEPPIGTAGVKKWHQEVFGLIPGLISWGIYNCRPPSQHSWANGEDVHGTKAQMQQVADYSVANHDRLNVAHVIYNREIWSYNYGYWRPYSGVSPHTDHVHVDFLPQRSGSCKVYDE